MSKSGKATKPLPNGLQIGSKAASRLEGLIGPLALENARRIQCAHCDLMILPETMARHVRLCHDDDHEAVS